MTKNKTRRRKAIKELERIAFSDESTDSARLSALKTLLDLGNEEKQESDTIARLDEIIAALKEL